MATRVEIALIEKENSSWRDLYPHLLMFRLSAALRNGLPGQARQ
jgi:hypothetical protein